MDWRSWLFVLGQILFTPLFSILTLLTFPLSRVQRNRIISLWARAMLFWLRLTCNIRYEVQGLERLPKQPCIILSKHQSAWETLAF
ncbi:MAG: 1-acyl-sn-glycerol-3-phosphate acyltransferase, partial [Methylophilaceae bacterium]|nr:1-acyl-sn-glycerol-3-phosphate acyltransferase [Methylophilaceae bacterium]